MRPTLRERSRQIVSSRSHFSLLTFTSCASVTTPEVPLKYSTWIRYNLVGVAASPDHENCKWIADVWMRMSSPCVNSLLMCSPCSRYHELVRKSPWMVIVTVEDELSARRLPCRSLSGSEPPPSQLLSTGTDFSPCAWLDATACPRGTMVE
jgi:hypothetical protein